MKRILGFWVLTMSIAGRIACAEPAAVEIFTDGTFPIRGIDAAAKSGTRVTLFDLDAPKRWAAELNTELPGNPQAARTAAMAWIEANGGIEQAKRDLQEAYAGHLKAFRYGIKKLPAIVFDGGASVIYGVKDLTEALDRYRNRSARNE